MGKIRINELARELEVKSNVVIEYLAGTGIPDKKSHSSALDDDLADKVRAHFRAGGESAVEPEKLRKLARRARATCARCRSAARAPRGWT